MPADSCQTDPATKKNPFLPGAAEAEPHLITVRSTSREVLRITAEGRFVLGEEATVDEAAKAIVEVAEHLWLQRIGGFSPEDVKLLEEEARLTDAWAKWCPEGWSIDNPTDQASIADATRKANALRSIALRIKDLLPPQP